MSQQENPFETPSPKGIRLVQATLRVIVAIQCWGYAASHLHHGKSYIFLKLLKSNYNLSDEQVVLFTDYAAYFLIGYGVVTLFRPMWLILMPLTIWQTGMAVSLLVLEPGIQSQLEMAEQSVRFVVPTSLLAIDFWPPRVKPTLAFCLSSIRMLRLATAVTFLGQGLMALYQFQNGGEFVELVTLSAQNLFDKAIEPAQARQVLAVVGVVDIVAAVSLMSSRNRFVAFLLVLWGLTTAASYTFAYGFEGYDSTLIRIASAGAPLAVLTFWMTAYKEQDPIILPEPGFEEDT